MFPRALLRAVNFRFELHLAIGTGNTALPSSIYSGQSQAQMLRYLLLTYQDQFAFFRNLIQARYQLMVLESEHGAVQFTHVGIMPTPKGFTALAQDLLVSNLLKMDLGFGFERV